MTKIFVEIFKTGLWMTPVMAATLLFFSKNSKKYSVKAKYWIYLIIAARLLIPWNIELPEKAVPLTMTVASTETANVPMDMGPAAVHKRAVPVDLILCVIWAGGMAAIVIKRCADIVAFRRSIKAWKRPPSKELEDFYASIPGKKPELIICPVLPGPVTMGIVKPAIYLPREDYEDMEMILQHELVHCIRHDTLYKLVLIAARTIHWFNPMVLASTAAAQRALEISCDAEVVRDKDIEYRRRYSKMLLREQEKSILTGLCLYGGKKTMKERFEEILSTKKRKRGLPIIIAALVLSISAGCGVKHETVTDEEQETIREMAEIWAEGLAGRNGEGRYNMMSERLRKDFRAENLNEDGSLNFSLGYSSPWVDSYGISVDGTTARIEYRMTDSLQEWYIMTDKVEFSRSDDGFIVSKYESTEPEPIE